MQSQHGLMSLLGCLMLVVALALAQGSTLRQEETVQEQFASFVARFGKTYAEDRDEYARRLAIFSHNLARIAERNANSEGVLHGVTKFADMTLSEFELRVLMRPPPLPEKRPHFLPNSIDFNAPAPEAFDWRDKGVLTEIYDQGSCGACWAFSATENIESMWAIAGHKLVNLSMQQILDCDPNDFSCSGGWPYLAFEYVLSAGLESLASYPYDGMMMPPCDYNASEVVAKINGYTYVGNGDENKMANFVAKLGPISVCLNAPEGWTTYTGGVYPASECDPTNINHCVLAVGYNTTATPPYWIIRNSWSEDWGMKGYLYLEFGKNACAVSEVATSAIVV